jgi:isoquinoline 1-oxidoreductase beta subunit
MLMQAAANRWNVPVGEVMTQAGVITHALSGRTLSYGKVADDAAKLTPPEMAKITLKKPSQWRIAGKSMRRLDTADKVDGRKVFSIDLQLPGMLNAAVMQSPVFGGKLVSYDERKIAKMRGVKGVVKINDSTLAVVADTFWRAKTALAELPIVWDDGVNGNTSSATIDAMLREGLTAQGDFWQRKEGDAPAVIAQATKKVEATYTSPFLAHATMEPMNCTVRITGNRAEAWVQRARWLRWRKPQVFRCRSAMSTRWIWAAGSGVAAATKSMWTKRRRWPKSFQANPSNWCGAEKRT